jgi:arylsulfatase A-like enzyme
MRLDSGPHVRPGVRSLLGVVAAVVLGACSSQAATPSTPVAPSASVAESSAASATPVASAPTPSASVAAPTIAAGGSAALATSRAVAAADAPDIIVLMVDDLGYLPDDRVLERLPNIKKLWLDGGLRFTRFFDETPLCCPARATFLSGQHTLHHGVTLNDGDLFDPTTTLATALDDAGYQTMLMGKYLNDYEGTRTPPGWDRVLMRERNVGAYFSLDGQPVDYGDMHFDDALRAQVAPWIREASTDAPIFALVTPRAPHRHPQKCERGQQGLQKGCTYMPLVMEQDQGAAACAGIPDFKPPNYGTEDNGKPVPWSMPDFPDGWPLVPICESLLVVDRMVKEIVDAQAERGRPAYFVFLSDNGMAWGQKSFPQKHVPPATQLPFYLAGPGIEPGETDAFLSNVDLGPTLAALAGTSLPGADGTSFLPLDAAADDAPDREILELMPADPDGFYDGWAAVRTPQLRYIRWDSGVRELYDEVADEWELDNLVDSRPDDAARLDARLDELLEASKG